MRSWLWVLTALVLVSLALLARQSAVPAQTPVPPSGDKVALGKLMFYAENLSAGARPDDPPAEQTQGALLFPPEQAIFPYDRRIIWITAAWAAAWAAVWVAGAVGWAVARLKCSRRRKLDKDAEC
jgi:hypothetical protein